MIALLDVNVLVSLFDPTHTHHETAHRWYERERGSGWSTCPITENGLVRVLTNPKYPGRRTTAADMTSRLERFRDSGRHTFWSDDLSLCDSSVFRPARTGSHRKLTDIYLLALAVENGGRFATFDRTIPLSAVVSAEPTHLEVMS